MLNRLLPALVLSATCIGPMLAAPHVAAAAVSYPLTCMIGTSNALTWGTLASPGGASAAVLSFKGTSGPASAGLQAGQCAFVDRGVRPTEPTSLCISTTLIGFSTNPTKMVFNGPGASTAVAATGSPQLLSFMVHNDAANDPHGCFTVDKYGP